MSKSFKHSLIAGWMLIPSIAFASESVWTSSANIIPSCIVTDANLTFGTIPVLSMVPQTDQATQFSVTCTVGSLYQIQLGPGLNFSNNNRHLNYGSGSISYNLYKDSARTQVWGDGSNGSVAEGVGTGAAQNYDVYGRINAQAFNANPNNTTGTYTDTVNITVDF